ncbi:MAG TPA: 2Fe-2S iron-sulfur cluster-binding protein, partial [Oligoflexia bacterium]|nr:2Fe-2S iron-sulfur cluster-binding protein [Oligoflexia bacterium]
MAEQEINAADLVKLTIDGKQVCVPKGTNLIEAALSVGIEIPFYCYHRHLSVAGNCRMCQVEIAGMPKLTIACNTIAVEGMVVRTHHTSPAVVAAQRATLEFLLLNHPLDCTVCDEAGHCKLQDYYYEYSASASRVLEDKVRKVKAQPLGPEVIYDGERCIMCTRCVRFCAEITKTAELAVLERSDRSVIGVHPGKELNNPLSGTVCDLCPVGALTHRRWRFNTRFWYTQESKSICTGCSTGCNARIAVRDEQIVLVRARLNSAVNQEWMCDEGRYGFERFQPCGRLARPVIRSGLELRAVPLEESYAAAANGLRMENDGAAAMLLSPLLTLEEMWLALCFFAELMGGDVQSAWVALQLKRRKLNSVEQLLVSPDLAANAWGLPLLGAGNHGDGDYRTRCEENYLSLLARIRRGEVRRLLLVGDRALLDEDLDIELIDALLAVEQSVAITPRRLLDGESLDAERGLLGAHQLCRIVLPG